VSQGAAWVGVLHLPADFVPVENVAYAMVLDDNDLRVVPVALDQGLDVHERFSRTSHGIADVVTQPVWPKPADPRAVTVRFLTAFPEANAWSVYGVSQFPVKNDGPSHLWLAITAGRLEEIDAPMDATGMGLGQILTTHPIWPGPDGQGYTLSQTPQTWRKAWHDYHLLLADAADDETKFNALPATLASTPRVRDLVMGRPERAFCRYLARLREADELTEDVPQNAEVRARREAILRRVFQEPESTEGEPARTRRPGP